MSATEIKLNDFFTKGLKLEDSRKSFYRNFV